LMIKTEKFFMITFCWPLMLMKRLNY